MNKFVNLSVLICTRNRRQHLRRLLIGLSQQNVMPEEVVLVEDISEGQVIDRAFKIWLKEVFSNKVKLQIVRVRNKKIGFSRNTALDCAKNELVVFVDDDVELDKDYLENVWKLHREYPKTPGFVGRLKLDGQGLWTKYLEQFFNKPFFKLKDLDKATVTSFSAVALSKKLIDKNQLRFDEEFMTGEDVAFCVNMNKKKMRFLWSKKLRAVHRISRGLMPFLRRFSKYGKDLVKLNHKYPESFGEVEDFWPKQWWYWMFFPLYFVLKPISQARAELRYLELEKEFLWPSWLKFQVYAFWIIWGKLKMSTN